MKRAILWTAVAVGLVGISGCSGMNETGETIVSEAKQDGGRAAAQADVDLADAVYGEVKVIGEGSVTLALGEMNQRGPGGQELPGGMTPGEMPEGELPEGVTPGEMPEGEWPTGDMPEGEWTPGDMPEGQMPSMIELTGEEQEIAVPDGTEITRQQNRWRGPNGSGQDADSAAETETAAEAAELAVGDIVAVTLNDDGSAARIVVMTPQGMPENMPQNDDKTDLETGGV